MFVLMIFRHSSLFSNFIEVFRFIIIPFKKVSLIFVIFLFLFFLFILYHLFSFNPNIYIYFTNIILCFNQFLSNLILLFKLYLFSFANPFLLLYIYKTHLRLFKIYAFLVFPNFKLINFRDNFASN